MGYVDEFVDYTSASLLSDTIEGSSTRFDLDVYETQTTTSTLSALVNVLQKF